MAVITVSSGSQDWYSGPLPTLKLRIYNKKTFASVDNEIVLANALGSANFYKEITCDSGSGVVNVPTFTLPSTTDGTPNDSDYTLILYDLSGNPLKTICDQKVPGPTPTPTTLAAIFRYNQAVPVPLPPTYYTAAQVDTLLAALVGAATKATDAIYGVTKLSQPALLSSDPIALGTNDKRWVALTRTYYLENYLGDLGAAITAIGSTPSELVFSNPYNETIVRSIPVNILCRIEGNGLITTSGGGQLTFNSLADLEHRQYFGTTSNILFGKNACPEIRLEWFTGVAATGSLNVPIAQIFTSLTNNGGGILSAGLGEWDVNGKNIPNGTILRGAGSHPDAASGTIFKIPSGTNNSFVFGVTSGYRNVTIEHCVLDCGTATGSYPFQAAGQDTAGFGLRWNDVVLHNGQYGIYCHSTGGVSQWQMGQVHGVDCQFIGQTLAAFHNDSSNGTFQFDEPFISCGAGVDGFSMVHNGALVVNAPEFAGQPYPTPVCVTGLPNPLLGGACFRATGQHTSIVVNNPQDEGMAYYYWHDISDDSYIFQTIGGTVQSLVHFEQSGNVQFKGTTFHFSDTFSAKSGALGIIDAQNCPITLAQDICGNSTGTARLAPFDATNLIILKQNVGGNFTNTTNAPSRFQFNSVYDGQPQLPIVEIGYYSATSEDKLLLRLGRIASTGLFDFYYDFRRDQSTGNLLITGNQLSQGGFCRIVHNGEINALSLYGSVLYPAQITTNQTPFSPTTNAQTVYVTSNADYIHIGGLTLDYVPYPDSYTRYIVNGGTHPFALTNEDVACSDATTRLLTNTGNTLYLMPGCTAKFMRSGASGKNRWLTSLEGVPKSPVFEGAARFNTVTALTPGTTVTVDGLAGDRFTLTPAQNCTLNAINIGVGQPIWIDIVTSGGTSFNVTLGTGFINQGVLATGTVTGKQFALSFMEFFASWVEQSRTIPM